MAHISGWTSTSNTNKDLGWKAELLSVGISAHAVGPEASLDHDRTSRGSLYYSRDGIQTCIEGLPQWADPALASMAAKEGHSSTLARAYQDFGVDLFSKLHGHFSLAVADNSRRRLLVAVDRMGTRPMCYALTPTGIAFASSADTVRRHDGVDVSISYPSLYSYIYFHVIPSPQTVYRGIYKLEPAQYLEYRDGHLRVEHYWSPRFDIDGSVDLEGLKEALQTKLEAAVRARINGRTGAFLSGGLDSSTVSGMLSRALASPVDTFSIGFSEEGYDEIGFARIAANRFKTNQHEYYVTTDDVADAMPRIAEAYDEPFGNSSAIPTLLCARLAHEHGMDTLLAGDGGDELFAGNERYAKQRLFDMYNKLPAALRRGILEPLFLSVPLRWPSPAKKIRSYIEQAQLPMPKRMQSYNLLNRIPPKDVFEADFLSTVDLSHPDTHMLKVYDRTPSKNLLHRMLFLDWKLTLADNDLRKVNRMCELAGVDVRYPMLDDAVVELSTRIPPLQNLRGGSLRWFYKNAFKDFLPQEILTKPKHGFGLPFGQWLNKSARLQDLVYTSLDALRSRRLVQGEFIRSLLDAHRNDHAAYYGTTVWVLVLLEQWLQTHEVDI